LIQIARTWFGAATIIIGAYVAELLKPATDRPGRGSPAFSVSRIIVARDRNPATLFATGGAVSRQSDSDAGRVFIGYARVSTRGQDLDQQRAALGAAGCIRIFEEKASGAKRDRSDLARMLDHLRAGDVVTITRLDRLARSTGDLLNIAERIKNAGAGLRSLAEPLADTTTPAGRMVRTAFARIADFERSLIVERTSAGRIAAKARGVRFGPSPALSAAQIAHARQLIKEDKKPVAEVARLLGVHRATLYRALEKRSDGV